MPNWIGDVVMATPTLRALRDHFGKRTRIVGIHRPYVNQVLAGTDLLDGVIEYHPKSKNRSLHSWSVVRKLRQEKLDSALLLPNSARSALIALAAGIPQRIGYVRYGRGPLLTEKIYPLRAKGKFTPISAVDYYLELAKLLGATTDHAKLELGTTAEFEKQTDAVWNRLNLQGHNVVTINTGGAYGAAKSWPEEYFAKTANQLSGSLNAKVLIVCGPSEQEAAARIGRIAANPNVISLDQEQPSICFTKATIRRSQLLISTDSGPRFFGPAFGVPTLTIFGPTDPRWSEPHHPLSINIRKDMPCGPCGKRTCPLKHHQCMRDLTPEFVISAAMNLWQRSKRFAA